MRYGSPPSIDIATSVDVLDLFLSDSYPGRHKTGCSFGSRRGPNVSSIQGVADHVSKLPHVFMQNLLIADVQYSAVH